MVCEPVVKVPLQGREKRTRRPQSEARSRPQSVLEVKAFSLAARGRALLESHYDLIQRKLQIMGRRSSLPDHEAEEFRSWALFKLVEDDYRILGKWEERSSFSTYLTVVLVNLMRDYRIRVWGKWRPSAVAQRLGEEALLLEELLVRDSLSLEEAIRRMRMEKGISTPASDLEALALKLPQRAGRRWSDEGELLRFPVDGQVEERLMEGERVRAVARLHEVLPVLLGGLPAEERLLLKLRYRDNLSMAAISPILGVPQRELYSRCSRCLKNLRRSLERAGLDASCLGVIFGER